MKTVFVSKDFEKIKRGHLPFSILTAYILRQARQWQCTLRRRGKDLMQQQQYPTQDLGELRCAINVLVVH
jgi:hypothetical protein